MKNELAFQTKLVDAINEAGGHAFKSNNRFKAGILDIHYTINETSAFVECKFERLIKDGYIEAHATPKQQQFARYEREAGGTAIGLCFIQHKKERNTWAIVEFDPTTIGNPAIPFSWNRTKLDWEFIVSHYLPTRR